MLSYIDSFESSLAKRFFSLSLKDIDQGPSQGLFEAVLGVLRSCATAEDPPYKLVGGPVLNSVFEQLALFHEN